MKVLYILANAPQDCESYIEAEIKYALKRDVQVEIWTSFKGYGQPPVAPLNYGSVHDTIGRFKPDVIHIHYLVTAQQTFRDLSTSIPVTVRAHSFDWDPVRALAVASHPAVRAVYAFPHFAREVPPDRKIVPMPVAYDYSLYNLPSEPKDRRLVLRLASGRRVKGLRDFLEIGNRVPEARFVLGVTPIRGDEAYLNELQRENGKLGGRVEVRTGGIVGGLSRADVVALTAKAGIYLETNDPNGHRLGMQISIAEAMATGAYVLARWAPTLEEYVGDGAAPYRSVDEAVAMVRQTFDWTDAQWDAQGNRAVVRSTPFRSDVVLGRLVDDWARFAK